MESLVKFTQEHLSKLNDAQLRKVLRKDFGFAKGTSIMSSQELVDQILKLKQAKQDEIDANSGLDEDVIYTDLTRSEWKIEKIKDGVVHIYNADGHKTNTTITSMKQTFSQMRYTKFTVQAAAEVDEVVEQDVTEQDVTENACTQVEMFDEAPEPKVDVLKKSKIEITVDGKKISKSGIVRALIQRESEAGNDFNSGSIMKMLEAEHGLKIHRSFCSSLIAKAKV